MHRDDDAEIIAAARVGFLDEAADMLQQFEQALLVMETDPADAENLNAAFRAAHTIKGTAGLFGCDAVVLFTHEVETLLEGLRSGALPVTDAISAALLEGLDQMAALLDEVRSGRSSPAVAERSQVLGARLRQLYGAPSAARLPSQPATPLARLAKPPPAPQIPPQHPASSASAPPDQAPPRARQPRPHHSPSPTAQPSVPAAPDAAAGAPAPAHPKAKSRSASCQPLHIGRFPQCLLPFACRRAVLHHAAAHIQRNPPIRPDRQRADRHVEGSTPIRPHPANRATINPARAALHLMNNLHRADFRRASD